MKLNVKVMLIIIVICITCLSTLSCDSNQSVSNEDSDILNSIILNEKSLAKIQLNRLDFDAYKNDIEKLLSTDYSELYINSIKKNIDQGSFVCLATVTPIYYDISKVYGNEDDEKRVVFVKSPVDDSTSQLYKKYFFVKDKGKWKISKIIEYYIPINKTKELTKVMNEFATYDGGPIQYQRTEILK